MTSKEIEPTHAKVLKAAMKETDDRAKAMQKAADDKAKAVIAAAKDIDKKHQEDAKAEQAAIKARDSAKASLSQKEPEDFSSDEKEAA